MAELSLDSVTLDTGCGESLYRELEVELLSFAPEETLVAIAACLQDEWNLRPEPCSKRERAVTLLDSASASDERQRPPPWRGTSFLPARGLG